MAWADRRVRFPVDVLHTEAAAPVSVSAPWDTSELVPLSDRLKIDVGVLVSTKNTVPIAVDGPRMRTEALVDVRRIDGTAPALLL